MKRIFAWLLLLTLMVGLFAGCKKTETETPTEPQEVTNGAQEAIDYLKAYYTDSGAQTPVDYTRFGIVRIGGVAYDVVWTVDVGEDLIKIVKNEDGTYTIDINEDAAEDTEYTLTATVTDANGNTASFSWKYILPKAQDMVAIVEAAYALKNGESLPYESRLRGKVISIDSIWSDDYQNITVTIAIEGIEDKPIKCYRMKAGSDLAEVIKNIQVGNIITVVGTLKNYEGTIEFDAGCQLIAWEKGDAVDAPTDPGEILKQAYALKDGQALPYVATLTGVVTKIDNPYDPAYGNISVVIEVEGYAKYPILCYRLKGLGVDQIAVDDLITVTGIIKNYKGTIEFDTGCQMTERVSGGGVAQRPSSDADKIIRDAKKLNPGESLPYRATLTGEIVSVDNAYDSSYGNVTVTIKVKGVKFQCYRLTGDGVDKIRETDTITVSGVIKNYNGKLEFDKGCTLDSWKKGPRNVNYGSAEEGVAYRLYLKQETLGQTLYFSGAVNGSRLQTTTTASKGADVFVEKISGKGVRFYYLSGTTKNYIEIEEYTTDDGKQRGAAKITTTPSCYWVYNSDVGCYIVNLPTAGKYFLGTYNSYNTITASWIGYVDGSMTSSSAQYIAHYAKADTVKDEAPKETVVQGTPVANPVVGAAYKFGFNQNQVDGKPFLAFAGKMSGYYYATTDKQADMTDVKLEAVSGGYHIYFMDNGTKTYLDVVPRENKEGAVNVVLQTSGTHSVYQLNTEHKYVYTTCIGEEWYLGTYGTNKSISASKTSYIEDTSKIGESQFCAWFNTLETVVVPPSTEPPVTQPPVTQPTGPAPTIPQNYVALYNPDSGKVATSTNKPYNSKDQLATADATLSGGMLTTSAYDVLALLQIDNGDGTVSFKTTDGKFLHADGTHVNLSASENDNTRFVLETTDGGYFIKLANATYNSKAQYLEYYAGSITSYGMNDTRANIYTFAFYPVTVVSTPTPTEPPVTNPPATEPAGESYVKITDASQFTTGKYVMIVNTGYAPGVVDGTWLTAVQPVVSDNTVTDAKGGVWTLTVNGSSVVIADSTGAMIGPKGGNSNGLSSGSYDWAWSFANGTFKFAGTGDDTVVLASNASTTGQYPGNHRFRGYKTTTVANDPATYPSEFTLYKLEGGSTEPDPSTPVTTAPPASNPPAGNGVTEVTELQAETAYKLAMNMNGTMGYFNGEVGNKAYYLGVTADHTQAVDVKLEAADGGYRMYFMDGTTKTYIRMYYKEADSKVRIEMTTTQPAEVVTYDDELRAIVFDDGTHDAYYMGSFGSYTTDISTSALSYISGDNASKIDVSQYPARFYTVEEGSEPPASNPPASSSNVVAEPQAETAYKMGMNISGTVYYFTGSTASQAWYLATSTNVADAIDVKLETADGGYYLYFMNGDVKTYIRVYQRTAGNPGEGKGSLELATAAPSEVFTFDETVKTLFYAYDSDNAYYMGTYGTYTNISASNTSYITGDNAANVDVSQFPARFYTVEAGGEPSVTEPDNTTAPTEPDNTTAPSEPTVPAQVKITFADLTKGTQYVAEHRDLDHGITLDTNNGCHITTQLRIYQDANYNGNAVFTCPKTLESVVINAGYKLANMVVYASEDGSQWDEVYNGALGSTTYTDYPITMPSGKDYKYLKIDSTSEQIRIQTITFNFKSE